MNVYVPAGNFVLDRLILNWLSSWSRPAASRYSSRRPPASSPSDPPILHAALVYVNILMVQDVLAEPDWAEALTLADRRGLTPLFRAHLLPYREFRLDTTSRLALGAVGIG